MSTLLRLCLTLRKPACDKAAIVAYLDALVGAGLTGETGITGGTGLTGLCSSLTCHLAQYLAYKSSISAEDLCLKLNKLACILRAIIDYRPL